MSRAVSGTAKMPAAAGTADASALPGSAELWASDDPALWSTVRGQLPAALEAASASSKSKAGLRDLDRWYRSELPAALRELAASGREPHISRDQLARLVEWKMAWGQWRPRLLAYAREQPDGAVEAASAAALALLRKVAGGAERAHAGGDAAGGAPASADSGGGGGGSGGVSGAALRGAVEALVALKGVGPATASALLAAADPHVPYMGDEAMAVCLPPARQSDYSLRSYLELAASLQGKARQLREAEAAHAAAPPGLHAAEGPPGLPPAAGEAARHRGDGGGGPASAAAAAAAAVGAGGESSEQRQHGGGWTASDVERCLWAAGVLARTSGADDGAQKGGAAPRGGAKQKRAKR